jgi:hypothetical protein
MLQPDADGLIQHQALFAALKEATGAAWDGVRLLFPPLPSLSLSLMCAAQTLGKTSGTKRAAATKDKPAAKKARGAIAADDDGDAGPGFDVNSLRGSTEESVVDLSPSLLSSTHLIVFFFLHSHPSFGLSAKLMGNTAVVLKEICRDLGLPVSGTKPVLVQRILAALS